MTIKLICNFYSFILKLGLTIGIIYLTLAFVFFISGVLLLRKLKKYFFSFYRMVSVKLWLSTALLSVTLLIRGILNVVRYADNNYLDNLI